MKMYREKVKLVFAAMAVLAMFAVSNAMADDPQDKKAEEEYQQKLKKYEALADKAVVQVITLHNSVTAKQQQCGELRQKWTITSTIANKKAWEKCQQDLDAMEKQLSAAKQYLDKGIYDAAVAEKVPIAVVYKYINNAKEKHNYTQ